MAAAALTRVRQDVRCRCHRGRLDRLIADGADTGSDPELELRARQLVSRRQRARLAAAVRRVMVEADRSPGGRSSVVPASRNALAIACPALATLAHELDSDEPVSPRGVALVMRLLGDPDSPLNSPGPQGRLVIELRAISAALEAR